MATFEVTIVKWADPEGIEKQEIGKLTLRSAPKQEGLPDCENFIFQIDEGSHPMVPKPLRGRGPVLGYPVRQSVWGLVREAIGHAITGYLCQ